MLQPSSRFLSSAFLRSSRISYLVEIEGCVFLINIHLLEILEHDGSIHHVREKPYMELDTLLGHEMGDPHKGRDFLTHSLLEAMGSKSNLCSVVILEIVEMPVETIIMLG